MPAITVDDVLVLPRIPDPDRAVTIERPVRSVTTAPRGFEGEGFPVKRAFAGVDMADLDPFIHMDEMGEVEWEPGAAKGTSWHPHRGFETVTYMLDGTFQHDDSNGGGGVISDGDTQWMTAGGGILHKEAPPEEVVAVGGTFHGIQLWVNLPSRLKMTAPRYQDIRGGEVRAAHRPRRRRPAPRDRRRGRRLRRSRRHPHPDRAPARHRASGRASCGCRGRPSTTRSSTSWRAPAPSGPIRSPIGAGQLAVLGAGDVVRIDADVRAGRPHADPRGAGARRPADPGAGGRTTGRS